MPRRPAAAGAGTPALNFGERIADAQVSLGAFKSTLWAPEWGMRADEAEAFAAPHDPQLLAALQAFALLFTSATRRVWVHLAAEMQAGKTGVIAAVARLILSNAVRLNFAPDRIFVVTGMSDDAWQKQTAPRLPYILRDNIHHGGTLSQVAEKLTRLARGEELKNVMIFIDESHYATAANNQPAKHVYDHVASLCERSKWAENNIRFMTISATDPAKVIAMKSAETPCHVVRLHTTSAYQSVEKLQDAGRVRYLEHIPENGALHTETGFAGMLAAVDELEATHGPMIHILRPQHGKGELVDEMLRSRRRSAYVRQWDVASNALRAKGSSSSSVGSASDINDAILNNVPEVTTFIILKGMFRAAKTLNDQYVGVLYDRVGAADATNLQSLLGRACGYGKSTRTVVFTSNTTVTNYIRCWRELCASKSWIADEGVALAKLNNRMPHTKAVKGADGVAKLVTSGHHATPFGHGIGAATAEDLAAMVARSTHNDDDYLVEWSQEFASLDALKASKLIRGRMISPDEEGFYKNPHGKKPMTRAELMAIKAGKTTTHMKLGEDRTTARRTYAFYNDPSDPSSVRFAVCTLTRKN